MVSYLLESTGTPALTADGRFITLTGTQELEQRIENLFLTQKGSETLFINYGFDYIGLSSVPGSSNNAYLLNIMVIDACSPNTLYGIKSVNNVDTSITGTTGLVSMSIVSDNGLVYNPTASVII